MSFQPFDISRDAAFQELAPYILRHQPIVHRSFDERLRNLDPNYVELFIEGGNLVQHLLDRLLDLQKIAAIQRLFIERQTRGTSDRSTPPTTAPQRNQPTPSLRHNAAVSLPEVRSWVTADGLRRIGSCLLPYINHHLIAESGTAAAVPAQCSDLNTDSAENMRRIHNQNILIRTINPNYHDASRMANLQDYSRRVRGILERVASFSSNPAYIVRIPAGDAQRAASLAGTFGREQPGQPTSQLTTFVNRIGDTITQLRNRRANILSLGSTLEYARAHDFDPEPVIPLSPTTVNRIDNPDAVLINWNHTDLLPVLRLPGSRRINSHAIDPVFAVAVTRFLKYLKTHLDVLEVYTEGFLRNPLSLNDPHPFGRSWDVTGFKVQVSSPSGLNRSNIAWAILHLRSGYPVTNLRTDLRDRGRARVSDLSDYRHGPSDWFNIAMLTQNEYRETNRSEVPLPENSRAGRLHQIVGAIPSFFGFVKGPGSDINHMDHFHIDLARERYSAPAIHCPATMGNPTPFIPAPRPNSVVRSGGQQGAVSRGSRPPP